MTVLEAVDLFYNEMANEIFNSSVDDVSKDLLIDDLKSVRKTVISTYSAELKIK